MESHTIPLHVRNAETILLGGVYAMQIGRNVAMFCRNQLHPSSVYSSTLKMDAAGSSKTLESLYQTI
jgi:hypothetical protein